jgi:hypothetical protein
MFFAAARRDFRIDPHEFVEPAAEGVGVHLVAGGIDGGVSANVLDGMPAPLEFAQGIIAAGIDGPANRNKHDASGRVG